MKKNQSELSKVLQKSNEYALITGIKVPLFGK